MEIAALFKSLILAGVAMAASSSLAQTVPHRTGSVKTEDVVIAYETFGTLSASIPVIAVNGGPGLSHAYMMQNDLWERVGHDRLVVLYDQRGTGRSKPVREGAPQTMEVQVADLDAVRAT